MKKQRQKNIAKKVSDILKVPKEPEEPTENRCDPKELRAVVLRILNNLVKQKNGNQYEFKVDDVNIRIINALSLYFANDPRFDKDQYSRKKGIILTGGVGTGKTLIMKAFSQNPLEPFKVVSVRTIADNYAAFGTTVIDNYSYSDVKEVNPNGDIKIYWGVCLDDLGTEELEKAHFANRSNVIQKIILNRYDNCSYNQTHFTTNLVSDQIMQSYESRAVDRLIEMANVIAFPKDYKSHRK